MRVFIAGIDGYLGWALAQYLTAHGHEVAGCDKFLRREWVAEMGSHSITPIANIRERLKAFREKYNRVLFFKKGDIRDYNFILKFFKDFQPESIVHLGEMPSAPYSMADVHHCAFTQTNNVIGTLNIIYAMKECCPSSHLVKLGTMGEYGTPNVDIPEGFFTIEYRGRTDTLPFPRQAGSWYHQSKVHDSNNVMFACRNWGLRSTDIMQGVVFGTRIDEIGSDERLLTRFDIDQCFGTVLNRYCAEAVIDHPLCPYGAGNQKRGFLPLKDSMQCLSIAINNPAKTGEYRVFNQFEKVYSISQLAEKVKTIGNEFGLNVSIQRVENPRKELEEHYYNPDHRHLLDLGYQPTRDIDQEIRTIIGDLLKYKNRILEKKSALLPDIRWDGTRRKSKFL